MSYKNKEQVYSPIAEIRKIRFAAFFMLTVICAVLLIACGTSENQSTVINPTPDSEKRDSNAQSTSNESSFQSAKSEKQKKERTKVRFNNAQQVELISALPQEVKAPLKFNFAEPVKLRSQLLKFNLVDELAESNHVLPTQETTTETEQIDPEAVTEEAVAETVPESEIEESYQEEIQEPETVEELAYEQELMVEEPVSDPDQAEQSPVEDPVSEPEPEPEVEEPVVEQHTGSFYDAGPAAFYSASYDGGGWERIYWLQASWGNQAPGASGPSPYGYHCVHADINQVGVPLVLSANGITITCITADTVQEAHKWQWREKWAIELSWTAFVALGLQNNNYVEVYLP